MKLITRILFFAFLFATVNVQAQGEVKEVKKGMSQGVNESFTVKVENMDAKELDKLLMEFLKDYKGKKGPKKNRKEKEIFLDDAKIPALSANTIDLYVTTEDNGDNTEVSFWFDLGGAYLSQDSHEEKMDALSEWMYEFNKKARVRVVELELKNEEDRLKEMNKDYDKLKKEQDKLEKLIVECQEKIKNAEKDLETNAADQENSVQAIGSQQKVVEQVKDKLKKID